MMYKFSIHISYKTLEFSYICIAFFTKMKVQRKRIFHLKLCHYLMFYFDQEGHTTNCPVNIFRRRMSIRKFLKSFICLDWTRERRGDSRSTASASPYSPTRSDTARHIRPRRGRFGHNTHAGTGYTYGVSWKLQPTHDQSCQGTLTWYRQCF